MSEPTGTLATPIGVVRYIMTQADHVFLHTESATDEAVTIRQIRYHLSFHCYLVNGQWTAKERQEPYLSRKDRYSEASRAARDTALETLSKAWTSYLSEHPSLTRKAALARATSNVEKLTSELDDLKEKTAAKYLEFKAARELLDSL